MWLDNIEIKKLSEKLKEMSEKELVALFTECLKKILESDRFDNTLVGRKNKDD